MVPQAFESLDSKVHCFLPKPGISILNAAADRHPDVVSPQSLEALIGRLQQIRAPEVWGDTFVAKKMRSLMLLMASPTISSVPQPSAVSIRKGPQSTPLLSGSTPLCIPGYRGCEKTVRPVFTSHFFRNARSGRMGQQCRRHFQIDKSRGKLFVRLVQQRSTWEPVPYTTFGLRWPCYGDTTVSNVYPNPLLKRICP